MQKIKVLLIGPCKVGKSMVANYLSEAIDNPETDYHPTPGVRILEYDSINAMSNQRIEVELWDCSGDAKYDACWPAFQRGANGVVLMVEPSRNDHIRYAEKCLGLIAGISNLSKQQLMVILCSHGGSSSGGSKLSGAWSQAHQISMDLREGGQTLRRDMAGFISHLAETVRLQNDREELSVLGFR
ncbi:hypothetical protein B566_EDAN003501 [Ephemera danica]|nr:hypothetical protein B566_EDAN003501 [Ephemera danica]